MARLGRRGIILGALALFALYWTGCGSSDGSGEATFTITGSMKSSRANVTHVMAVNPTTASPDRVLASVGSDGKYSLKVKPNRPYVLVFIDSTKIGKNMVVSIFRSATLDTLSPNKDSGEVDLKEMTTSGTVASAGIDYATLLGQLGLDAADALSLGAIDDLSLRYANPDIDGNGTIDMEESKTFSLDFHIRANVKKGSSSGSPARVSDMTDKFFDATGADAAYPDFTLSSIYAYVTGGPQNCASSSGVSTTLTSPCAFSDSRSTPSSFSNLSFGGNGGFGPDYNYTSSSDLPGSAGTPATLVYTFTASQVLTFSNVVTRTKASLTSTGTIMPFLKFETSGGVIKNVHYKWMQRVSTTEWALATESVIKSIVGGDGGYVAFYRGAKANSLGFKFPPVPSGSIAWAKTNLSGDTTVSDADFANTTPNDICSMAVSYDDKLGLRLFAGGADPNSGVTPCP